MNLYLPVCDQVGTVHALVAAVTNNVAVADPFVAVRYEYSPYGELLEIATDPRLPTASSPLLTSPIGFQSKLRDAETGFWYFGYRFFDSRCAQWLSHDPIREEGGFNLVAFCGGDPVNAVDPLGLVDVAGGVKLCFAWDEHGLDWEGWSAYGGIRQKIGNHVDLRADIDVRLYWKGLGQIRNDELSGQYDLTASVSATFGDHRDSAPAPIYYNSMSNASAFDNPYKNSLALGASWYYNSAIDDSIRTGSMNLKVDDFFFQYMNDVNKFPKIPKSKRLTDQGWTGGGVLGAVVAENVSGREWLEIGFQAFTGDPIKRMDTLTGKPLKYVDTLLLDGGGNDGYYDQDVDQLLLNRAEWKIRYRRDELALGMNISSSPKWNVQNWIHDGVWLLRVLRLASPDTPRFQYPEQDRRSLSIEYMP